MNSLKYLLPFLRPYRWPIVFGTLAALLSNVVGALAPWIMKLAIDALETASGQRDLLKYALYILGAAVVAGIFRFLMRRILIGMSRDVEYDMRNKLFSHLERLPISYYVRNRTGDLMARMTNDLESVRTVLGPGIMYPIDTITTAIFSLIMMFIISPKLTWMTLAIAPFVSVSVFYLGKLTHKLYTKIQEQYSAMSDMAQENLSGARVVRAFAQEDREMAKFDELNKEYVKRNVEMTKIQALFFPLMGFFFEAGAAIILLVGGRGIIDGTLSLGDFVAFVGYLGMLAWPMIAVGWVANLLQRGAASMKRIQEVLIEIPDIEPPVDGHVPESVSGQIELRNVFVKYTDDRETLSGISLKIRAGESVAFIGRTGCGKTTLVSLIPRLLDPDQGEVLIDGIPTTKWNLNLLRENIGMVPQDPFLFSDSVNRNIQMGSPREMDSITEAAEISQISVDVEGFAKRYETVVGERGLTLSGGQKGRVSLARALIRNPKILILDDSLSAVDTHTEEEILRRLRLFMKGRTSIIISHRVSTVRDADRVYVLENGKILESGTHDELLKIDGYYADLEARQRLERELEIEQ